MRTLKFECQSLASETKRPPLWVMVPLLHGLLPAIQTRILFQSKESDHAADHAYFGWNLNFLLYDRFTVPTRKRLTAYYVLSLCTKRKPNEVSDVLFLSQVPRRHRALTQK